jgi:hypothetical protein
MEVDHNVRKFLIDGRKVRIKKEEEEELDDDYIPLDELRKLKQESEKEETLKRSKKIDLLRHKSTD